MSVAAGVALRSVLWLLLGTWVGSWLLFGAVVAPTSFRVLPSTEMAGTVIGPVLASIHLFGGVAGVGLAIVAWALGRGPLLVVLPLLMSAVCLYSHFGITTEISEIRDLAFGPEGNEESAARFNQLHRLSTRLYVGVGVAALALLGLHARADTLRA